MNALDSKVQRIVRRIENARKKAFEKTLPEGTTYEMYVEKEAKKLMKYYAFLANIIEIYFNNQKDINAEIAQIEERTKQQLDKDTLVKELWILRYAYLHLWFLNLLQPKHRNGLNLDISPNTSLVFRAFQENKNTNSYLPWLIKGFDYFTDGNQLKFDNLEKLEEHFNKCLSNKIHLIAFNSTGGRLGGEQYDSVVELVMKVVECSRKIFIQGKDVILTNEEVENIKKVIEEMKPSSEDLKDVMEDFKDSITEMGRVQ